MIHPLAQRWVGFRKRGNQCPGEKFQPSRMPARKGTKRFSASFCVGKFTLRHRQFIQGHAPRGSFDRGLVIECPESYCDNFSRDTPSEVRTLNAEARKLP